MDRAEEFLLFNDTELLEKQRNASLSEIHEGRLKAAKMLCPPSQTVTTTGSILLKEI